MTHRPTSDPAGLVGKWLPGLTADRVLVVDVPGVAEAATVDPDRAARFSWFNTYWPTHVALSATGRDSKFGAWAEASGHDGALVFLPKGRERIRMVLAMVAASIPPGSPLWVVGERKGGIQSARTDLALVADVYDEAAGRHARLLMSRARTGVAGSLDDYAHLWTLERAGEALEVVSFPGVFSHGRLDEGTRLLLETVPRLSGPLLDVGSGSGVIGAWYARSANGDVTLGDADALALDASRRTLAANGITGTVAPVDVLPPEGSFTSIVSNPPFHLGVSTDYQVIEALATGAPARLSRGGTLSLVCNRFLGAAKLLDRAFGAHELLKDDGRYRVYRATKR